MKWTMVLKGRRKTDYQREYMRKRRATKALNGQPELRLGKVPVRPEEKAGEK
jgi:hypothetical protein